MIHFSTWQKFYGIVGYKITKLMFFLTWYKVSGVFVSNLLVVKTPVLGLR